MKKLYLKEMDSILGKLRILCDDDFIIRLMFENDNLERVIAKLENVFEGVTVGSENTLACACASELQAYLDGRLRTFSVKPKFYGTVFDQTVWQGLMGIEYGKTVAYSALAASCGVRGARAVGGAVGRNPVPVIAPCHRVIRSDGGLGGFTGGIQNKQILMTIEGIKFE